MGTAQGGTAQGGTMEAAAVAFLAVRRHGVEIGGQPRAGGGGEVVIHRLPEGGPGWGRGFERMIAQGIVERAGRAVALHRAHAGAETTGGGGGLLDHADLDLVGAQTQAVAIAQGARGALAKRVGIGVQIGSVGAGVRDMPHAAPERDGEMAFRQQPVGIGEHPVHLRAAADVEFAAGDRAGLERHLVGAP